ncbi:MAG: PilN domain-containing protein [Candidatus Accumulibacter sp.]|jgi:type IV pilus assembly protein PilN|nr:PilN domain-containing protein [Accumulibacter sp.]
MIRINLLPHREEKRRAKRQQFYGLCCLILILGGLIVFLGYTLIDGTITAQQEKNDFLKREILALDKQIDQIKRLREQTQALLSRKQIIESLQRDRSRAVHLLSELVKQMPEGIYIRSVKQVDAKVSVNGFAQSSARVSALMRNIEASPWLERPQLIEVKASTVDRRRVNEFNMDFYMKSAAAPAPQQPQRGTRR